MFIYKILRTPQRFAPGSVHKVLHPLSNNKGTLNLAKKRAPLGVLEKEDSPSGPQHPASALHAVCLPLGASLRQALSGPRFESFNFTKYNTIACIIVDQQD